MREKRPRHRFALVLAAVLLAVLSVQAPAGAHDRHPGSIELFRGPSGPYDLRVTAVPLVDFLEVTVTFDPANPDAPLDYNPRVVISAEGQGAHLGPTTAVRPFGVTSNEYTATFEPHAPGEWLLVVSIDSEAGDVTLALPVAVVRGAGFPWIALIAGLGLVLPIAWLIFVPRKRAPRRGGGQNTQTELKGVRR